MRSVVATESGVHMCSQMHQMNR